MAEQPCLQCGRTFDWVPRAEAVEVVGVRTHWMARMFNCSDECFELWEVRDALENPPQVEDRHLSIGYRGSRIRLIDLPPDGIMCRSTITPEDET
jgi:hypothetical protein